MHFVRTCTIIFKNTICELSYKKVLVLFLWQKYAKNYLFVLDNIFQQQPKTKQKKKRKIYEEVLFSILLLTLYKSTFISKVHFNYT